MLGIHTSLPDTPGRYRYDGPMHRLPRAVAALCISLLAAVSFAACAPIASDKTEAPTQAAQADPTAEASDTFLERHGLAGLDAAAVIDTLEATTLAERPTNLMASVQPEQLILSDDAGNTTSMDIPADTFYVSIAPYANQTHDCYFHSLTTCRGELANEAVKVTVVADDGSTIIDGEYTTQDNGFVGLWLPRDISGTITLVVGEKSVTAPISTGDEDPTCITTLQVA